MNPSEETNSSKKNDQIDQDKANDSNFDDENKLKTITEDKYVFGWGQYSEITNGRFAMIGFAAIIIIELISKKSFLNWAGF